MYTIQHEVPSRENHKIFTFSLGCQFARFYIALRRQIHAHSKRLCVTFCKKGCIGSKKCIISHENFGSVPAMLVNDESCGTFPRNQSAFNPFRLFK